MQIQIDTVSSCYFNGITQKNETIENYQIKNISEDDYLTWVSLSKKNNRTNVELISDFFKKRKGDFSLIDMMNEDLLKEQPINIGYSFIKKIAPGEAFSYFIIKTGNTKNIYEERIVFMKKKDVEQYLKMEIDEKYFSGLSSVFLIVR